MAASKQGTLPAAAAPRTRDYGTGLRDRLYRPSQWQAAIPRRALYPPGSKPGA